jgi:hypothetical protein
MADAAASHASQTPAGEVGWSSPGAGTKVDVPVTRCGSRPKAATWRRKHMKKRIVSVALGFQAAMLAAAAPALAADPPESWTNERVLTCDGQTVVAYLTPAGFGSAFHVSGSTDVIKPKHVEVVFPGEHDPVITVDVPGFENSNATTVHCTYTDPAGLYVDLIGVRS